MCVQLNALLDTGDADRVHGVMQVLAGKTALLNKHRHGQSHKTQPHSWTRAHTHTRTHTNTPSRLCFLHCLCGAEFVEELDDTQLPVVLPVLAPKLFAIATQAEVGGGCKWGGGRGQERGRARGRARERETHTHRHT